MAVLIELHNAGDPGASAEIQALVEHALSDRAGDWRVSIVGSRENDSWEMKVLGPNGSERSYTLAGSAGEHHPLLIGSVLMKLLLRYSSDERIARPDDQPDDNPIYRCLQVVGSPYEPM
jgi:hypothetical protein